MGTVIGVIGVLVVFVFALIGIVLTTTYVRDAWRAKHDGDG